VILFSLVFPGLAPNIRIIRMMTLGIMTPSTTTLCIMTRENTITLENSNQTSIMAHRTMTLSIMTLNKMPLCKMMAHNDT
jgi:hypothetical protein